MKLAIVILIVFHGVLNCEAGFSVPVSPVADDEAADEDVVSEALLNCLVHQVCDCDNVDTFDECFEHLTESFQHWVVDKINECDLGKTIPYGNIGSWFTIMCSLPQEEKFACYKKVNLDMMEKVRELGPSTDEKDAEASVGFEVARRCMEPNMSFCVLFPDSCMSFGRR